MALVGDNGAGKSTLVKIIAGMERPTAGEIRLSGEVVHFTDASQSQAKGVQVVYQDLALADSQTVYMNLFLGREKVARPVRQARPVRHDRRDRRRWCASSTCASPRRAR